MLGAAQCTEDAPRAVRRGVLRKSVLLGLLLVAVVVVARWTPLGEQLRHLDDVKNWIRSFGVWAPLFFTLLTGLLVTVGTPRLALCVLAGTLFGLGLGLLTSTVGTLLGYVVVFLVVRHWGGRGWLLHRYPRLNALGRRLTHNSVPAVILFRQIPVHGLVMNVALAMSPIRLREFILGSLVGLLPAAVPMVMLGKFGTKVAAADMKASVLWLSLCVAVFAAAWMGWGAYCRRVREREAVLPLDVPSSSVE